jgi:hypothetical protein
MKYIVNEKGKKIAAVIPIKEWRDLKASKEEYERRFGNPKLK